MNNIDLEKLIAIGKNAMIVIGLITIALTLVMTT